MPDTQRHQPTTKNAVAPVPKLPQAQAITIRRAVLGDMARLIEMAKRFYESARLDQIAPFDAETVAAVVSLHVDGEDRVALVADNGETLVGMTLLVIQPYAFADGPAFCQEVAWWVEPEARKAGVGGKLFDAIEAWAKEEGATHIDMIALGSSEPAKAAQAYMDRGYRLLETHYLRRI